MVVVINWHIDPLAPVGLSGLSPILAIRKMTMADVASTKADTQSDSWMENEARIFCSGVMAYSYFRVVSLMFSCPFTTTCFVLTLPLIWSRSIFTVLRPSSR